MPKLSDTQAILLAAAAARPDLTVLPPPETIRKRGAALDRTFQALVAHGLIAEAAADGRAERPKREQPAVRHHAAGLTAIGVESQPHPSSGGRAKSGAADRRGRLPRAARWQARRSARRRSRGPRARRSMT